MLLKGHDEVRQAPDPLIAAQMALLRVMHAADLPDPGQLAKKLEEMAANGMPPPASSRAAVQPAPQARAIDWHQLVEQVDRARPAPRGAD